MADAMGMKKTRQALKNDIVNVLVRQTPETWFMAVLETLGEWRLPLLKSLFTYSSRQDPRLLPLVF